MAILLGKTDQGGMCVSSSSRKKDKIVPETPAKAPEAEENVCLEEEVSCPNSCASEDEENTTC